MYQPKYKSNTMKQQYKKFYIFLFILITFYTTNSAQQAIAEEYQEIITPYVNDWNEKCIAQLSSEDLVTITDILILSYQIIESSIIMSSAKLTMQSEIFNIVTLSINDSIETTVQAQNNDTKPIKEAINNLEIAQEKIKTACKLIQSFTPLLIKITPQVTKTFIKNIKKTILIWASKQTETINDFEDIKQEFITTAHLFANIRNIFDEIIDETSDEKNYLLEGANSVTTMYKNIEKTFKKLTITRLHGLQKLDRLFKIFFKMHYTKLFNALKIKNTAPMYLQSLESKELPHPEALFAL